MMASELSQLPAASAWATRPGPDSDVVISVRARLSRNLSEYPYPGTASAADREAAAECVLAAVRDELTPDPFGADSVEIHPNRLTAGEIRFLAERSISDDATAARIILTATEESVLLVGETDHLRIVMIAPGNSLTTVLERVRVVDRKLEQHLNYAFAMDWGYLSSNITNLGTGLRVSALVHVPALALLGRVEPMSSSMENSEYELAPYFADEASDGVGTALFVLRNCRTLGSDEEAIVGKLEEYTAKLVHYERAAREELRVARGEEIADSANRAFGILRFARSLSAVEARSLVSHLRLGIVAGLVSGVAAETVTTLLLINQDSHVERARTSEGEGERDTVRARMFRDILDADRA